MIPTNRKCYSAISIKQILIGEIMTMLNYLTSESKTLSKLAEKVIDHNSGVFGKLNLSNSEILSMYIQLSEKNQPAKPKTILLLYNESKKGIWSTIFGPVLLVQILMATTLIRLFVFIVAGLSSLVNEDSLSGGILNNNGIDLLLKLFFILSAAALGGYYRALFQINMSILEPSILNTKVHIGLKYKDDE